MKNSVFLRVMVVVILVLGLTACKDPSKRGEVNPNDPEVYCKPFGKNGGKFADYTTDIGEIRRGYEYVDYKSSAGFSMRIPSGMGWLTSPNEKCEMRSAEFMFRWVNGKLEPTGDYRTGKKNNDGTMVKYFVGFSRPEENPVRKFNRPKWMYLGAFRMPENERIIFLPFGDYYSSTSVPVDSNDRSKWRPTLLLEDARDLAGNSINFYCMKGYTYREDETGLHISVNLYDDYDKCVTNVAFVSGAGGRLDIYGKDFLNQGAAITNAVINDLNKFIIRE